MRAPAGRDVAVEADELISCEDGRRPIRSQNSSPTEFGSREDYEGAGGGWVGWERRVDEMTSKMGWHGSSGSEFQRAVRPPAHNGTRWECVLDIPIWSGEGWWFGG